MKINLKQFRKDFTDRVSPLQKSIPRVHLYELDLTDAAAKQEDLVSEECFASWTKSCDLNATRTGLRSPGWHTDFYKSMIGTNLETDCALANAVGQTNCVMQWLPGSCTKQAAAAIRDIAVAQLGSLYKVVLVTGDTTTNADAEQYIKDTIVSADTDGKKVWIISVQMAARSFSIPEIDTVLLTYDNGDMGVTLQKLSRALTADGSSPDKIGKIVAISIDPNRDDLLAPIVLDTAAKAAEQNGSDRKDEMRRTYSTIPLWSLDATGNQIRVSQDEYLERAMTLNATNRLSVNRGLLLETDSEIAYDLLLGCSGKRVKNRAGEKESGKKGKRAIDPKERERLNDPDEHKKLLSQLAESLNFFVEQLEHIRYFTLEEKPQLSTILNAAEQDQMSTQEFTVISGMTPGSVRKAVELRLIKSEWVDASLLRHA